MPPKTPPTTSLVWGDVPPPEEPEDADVEAAGELPAVPVVVDPSPPAVPVDVPEADSEDDHPADDPVVQAEVESERELGDVRTELVKVVEATGVTGVEDSSDVAPVGLAYGEFEVLVGRSDE